MKIKTNFNIGDEYWMPRVRYQYIRDTKLFGGLEYERVVPILVAYAKLKRITYISIEIDKDNTLVKYRCEDVLGENEEPAFEYNMSTLVAEANFKYKTKEEALAFAQNWQLTEKKEYFGEPL